MMKNSLSVHSVEELEDVVYQQLAIEARSLSDVHDGIHEILLNILGAEDADITSDMRLPGEYILNEMDSKILVFEIRRRFGVVLPDHLFLRQ